MARYHATVETRQNAADAFAYLADFSSTAQWDPGVVEAERLTEGPITIGATFRVVTLFLGRRIPLDYEVTALEPGRRVVLRADNGTIRSTDEITVCAADAGSVVNYDADLRLLGALRFADPLLRLAFRRIGDRARAGLARELDRELDR